MSPRSVSKEALADKMLYAGQERTNPHKHITAAVKCARCLMGVTTPQLFLTC